jgi:hypothetical protein
MMRNKSFRAAEVKSHLMHSRQIKRLWLLNVFQQVYFALALAANIFRASFFAMHALLLFSLKIV